MFSRRHDVQLLRAGFERSGDEHWAVIADELQTQGDPRGELIAVEQRLDRTPAGPERNALEAARTRIYEQHGPRWVGAPLWAARASPDVSEYWLQWTWRYGFLASLDLRISTGADDVQELLLHALDNPAATFLPRLSITAFSEAVPALVAGLSHTPRSVRSLHLDARYHGAASSPTISAERAAALCQALPDLRTLTLIGRQLFDDFSHPNLQVLRISGYDAIVGLGVWTELPRLRDLDFASMSGTLNERISDRGPTAADLQGLCQAAGMPALRRLGLARNTQGCRHDSIYLGGPSADVLFEAILDAPVLEQLRELTLPSPPSFELADQMLTSPRLRRLAAIHVPMCFLALDRDRYHDALPGLDIGLMYRHRPWAETHSREVMAIGAGDEPSIWLGYGQVLQLVESRYPELSPAAREAIDRLLDAFDALVYSGDPDGRNQVDLPYSQIATGFAELCEQVALLNRRITSLLEFLQRNQGRFDNVFVRKIWGW